jgi:uncharacterized delta-60 repeat protein
MTAAFAAMLLLAMAPAASARLHGKLDPSFGQGGKVLFSHGDRYAKSGYSAIARQPDGSLVLAGRTESVQRNYIGRAVLVQRRLPDGRLDPGFHQLVSPGGGYGRVGLAVEAGGDILYTTGGDYQGAVNRLNPDGTVDTSYGSAGTATVPFEPAFLAIDSQGRTVVAGTAGIGGNCHDCLPTPVMAVARLLPDGNLDKSFGKGGTLLIPLSESNYGGAVGLALEPDGSIVVAGMRHLFGVTADGTLNAAFGKEGNVAVEASVGALAETTTGDVVAATTTSDCCGDRGAFLLQAYRPDGSLDPSWGSGGKLTIQVADVDIPTALQAGPEGTLMFGGEAGVADEAKGCRRCEYKPYVARISAGGAVDPSFSAQLTGPTDPYREVGESYSNRVAAFAVLPGGGVALAATIDPDGSAGEQAAAISLSASGALEAGFGSSGVAADHEPLPGDTGASAFAAGPHGTLVATYWSNGGTYNERGWLGAWSPDGKPVTGYGGEAELSYAEPARALEADGRGRLYRIEGGHTYVRRFGVDGRPDPGYGTDGKAQLPADFVTKALEVRRDGTALAVGRNGKDGPMALFELTPAGLPDRHFGKRGLVQVRWGEGQKATALSATFDRRGRIVLFGLVGHETPLARLLPNGRLDRSFGHGGRINFKPELAVEDSSLSVAKDGRIYLATSPERGGETTLVRFRGDGVRDRSFGTGGVVRIGDAPALVRFFVSGRQLVLVSGTGIYKYTGFALRAFHLDGSLDRSFARQGVYEGGSGVTKGLGVIGAVREPDGDIVVAGTKRPRSYGEQLELLRFR